MDVKTKPEYEALLLSIGDGIIATDKDGKVIFMNSAAETSLGWKSEEFLGKKLSDVLGLYDEKGSVVSLQERPFEIALTTGNSITTAAITTAAAVYFYQRKDGTRFPVALTVTAIMFNKEAIGTIGVFRDISREVAYEKMRTEKEEQEKEIAQKDEATLASIESGIISVDAQERIIAMSRVAEEMLGWKLDEIRSKNLSEIVPLVDEQGILVPKEKKPMFMALATGKITDISSITPPPAYFYTRKDGTKFPVGIAVAPILLDGKIVGAIDNFRDITKEKELEKAKSDFMSLAAHQLRTPPIDIEACVQELQSQKPGPINEKQAEFLKDIYASNQRMIALISSLLNISRIEMGTFAVTVQKVDIKEIIDETIRELMNRFRENIEIKKNYDSGLGLFTADPSILQIIFDNLISNAIKYSPSQNKKIEITVTTKDDSLLVSVKDNGIGIPEKDQHKIFGEMFRSDNAVANSEGSGLGLYMVKKIVDVSGGKIWFESKENEGTTFYVSFPSSGFKEKPGTTKLVKIA